MVDDVQLLATAMNSTSGAVGRAGLAMRVM